MEQMLSEVVKQKKKKKWQTVSVSVNSKKQLGFVHHVVYGCEFIDFVLFSITKQHPCMTVCIHKNSEYIELLLLINLYFCFFIFILVYLNIYVHNTYLCVYINIDVCEYNETK